MMKNDQY